ncbi:MAG TPA: YggT family protein [Solirubrobacteraceae bacterium]|jgi:YggT family protein|nr:YggT family protein [Solirubrobacteraceae bacterium]
MSVVLASARTDVAGYLETLIYVYTLLIVAYIVVQLLFAFGVRPPYSRATDAVLTFLRDICEPYLRIFRRIIPMAGMLDFSPIVAILVLTLINTVVVRGLIRG